MNDIYQYLIVAKTLVDGVSNNKVANFAYTQTAYTEDIVDGVPEYSYGNDQNIPLVSHTDLEQNVRDKGIRSQAASLPRNAINHFFGRVSYNLNKITDTLNSFIAQITRAFTQNGSFYSALAEYKQYDTCTILVTEDGGNLLKTFLRTSSVPEVIQGVIPISDGVINTEHWKLMYSTDTVTQLTADSSTKIASTELVDNKIEAYNSLVNAVLATKANLESPAFTGSPTVDGETVLHSGNIGSVSGLNAATLDGEHRSVFMERKNQYISDFDAISSSMVGPGGTITFESSFAPANRPSGEANYYTGFISNQTAGGYLTVLAFGSIASDNFWFRRLTGGVWGSWQKVWNSGNMVLPFGSEGASGLNTLVYTVKVVADANNIDGNGIIFSTHGSPTNFPTVNYYSGIQFYIAHNPGYKVQIIHGNSHGSAFIRYSHNGSWGSWYKLWNEGNDGPGSGLAADTAATADYATSAGSATTATNATHAAHATSADGAMGTLNTVGTELPTPNSANSGKFFYVTSVGVKGLHYCAHKGSSTYQWIKIGE